MNKEEVLLIKKLEMAGLTQIDIATFLGSTRQTVSKILSHDKKQPFEIKSKLVNLELIKGKDVKNAKKIIEIYLMSLDAFKKSIKVEGITDDYYNMLFSSLEYFHHWITEEKYSINIRKNYLKYIKNFYARINPTYMFFTSFNKNRALLTYNINERTKQITEYVIYDCYEDFAKKQNTNLSFVDFVDEIYEFFKDEKYKIMIFLDAIDNDFDFIRRNLKLESRKKLDKIEYFDLARIYNTQDNFTIGGIIECVLENFNINFDESRLLKEPLYRAEKTADLIKVTMMTKYQESIENKNYNDIDNTNSIKKKRKIQKGSIK